MTEVTLPVREQTACTDESLQLGLIELLFFAYRDFTSDPDELLLQYGFGRAHHRVLHFVTHRPGMTVAELLEVLRITKQSLARVLKQLIDTGYIIQIPGPRDRRQRELYATQKGKELALALALPQSRRINTALREAGIDRAVVEQFLRAMVNPERRRQLDRHQPGALAAEDDRHDRRGTAR
ncbi:MarR family transcriptional regulator [Chelativorans composti]|jgi:Transcriptional regulators|uniref:MarR family winged helix-turn-helix transcriptional regulator n=1 Tax=Chelativorans composti TaxID=768533 RepID=A0ABW5DEC4_9HYPH